VDGELVVMVNGGADFAGLQRRAATRRVEAPAMLAVFDLLAPRGVDLRPLPYRERRARLEHARPPAPGLVPGAGDQRAAGRVGVDGVTATGASRAWWRSGATRDTCLRGTRG
jgi:ATP-dependent DNA ligase